MNQSPPEYPTNVQTTNPYMGLDRGLFIIGATGKYARVHSARWNTKGPTAGIGILQYEIMQYDTKPVADVDYLAGTLVTAPGGGTLFDCLTRGLVSTPILAEYWGKCTFHNWYSSDTPQLLTELEKTTVMDQARAFTTTMGAHANVSDVDYTVTYNQTVGGVLSISSQALIISYKRFGVDKVDTLTEFTFERFDPVQYALSYVKGL